MNFGDSIAIVLLVLSVDTLLMGLGDIPFGNVITSFVMFCSALFFMRESNHWKDNL